MGTGQQETEANLILPLGGPPEGRQATRRAQVHHLPCEPEAQTAARMRVPRRYGRANAPDCVKFDIEMEVAM